MSGPSPSRPPGEVRVLRVFSRLNIGGPGVHVILLTAGLASRGYRTRLVIGHESPHEGNLLDLAAAKGVTCVRLPGLGREIRPWNDARALVHLRRAIREFRPDVVHTHTAKAGLLGRLAARLEGVRVIVHTYHGHVLAGYFGRLKTGVFRAIETWLGRRTSALVTVSESVRQDLAAHGVAPAERIRVVPLGLEIDDLAETLPRGRLRAQAGFDGGAPLVGIVGRLAPIKDVGTFLQAAARLHAAQPALRFSVVGDGESRAELEAQARALGLTGVLHFHGWQRDMAAVYGDLDVVVNCSRNEGTPVALIEALAAARPVVATAVGGTPDLLGAGAHGILVPPGDAGALAAAIERALAGGPEIERARQAGQSHVLGHHSVRRLLDDVDRLYRELLAAPAAT
jgi:glycosyltransferase involved in cell wall biosynthesis